MCNPASMLATAGKIWWSKHTDSHDELVREFGIHQDGKRGPNVVRIELLPPGPLSFDAPLSKWQYVVDQDVFPEWYDAVKYEKMARRALVEWVKEKVICGEADVTVTDRQVYVCGRARVTANGRSWVTVSDRAFIKAYGDTRVTAWDSSEVAAHDSAEVNVGDSVKADAYDDSMVTARNYAVVTAFHRVKVEAFNWSRVFAYDRARVTAVNSAWVLAHDEVAVKAYDGSFVALYGTASAEAYDSAVVKSHAYVDRVVLKSPGSVAIHAGTGKVSVRVKEEEKVEKGG